MRKKGSVRPLPRTEMKFAARSARMCRGMRSEDSGMKAFSHLGVVARPERVRHQAARGSDLGACSRRTTALYECHALFDDLKLGYDVLRVTDNDRRELRGREVVPCRCVRVRQRDASQTCWIRREILGIHAIGE